jgi:phosphoribosylanthranilate isomerase
MNLDRVTITGADDSIQPQALADLSAEFPFVEWAILLGSREGFPRWPSTEWREELERTSRTLRGIGSMNLSLHLCGRPLRDLLLHGTFPVKLARGYQRMQFNFHGEPVRLDMARLCVRLRELAALGTEQFIFQIDGLDGQQVLIDINHAGPHDFTCVPLFDLSHGAGLVPGEWPKPLAPGVYHGYAGGLGPDNLAEQLPKIAAAAGEARIWIDMETRVRSDGDRLFDLDKVQEVLEIAKPFIGDTQAAAA